MAKQRDLKSTCMHRYKVVVDRRGGAIVNSMTNIKAFLSLTRQEGYHSLIRPPPYRCWLYHLTASWLQVGAGSSSQLSTLTLDKAVNVTIRSFLIFDDLHLYFSMY
jgi:hypothetical protein